MESYLCDVSNQELQALTEDVIPVMWDDAKPSSHAIVVRNVTSAADITSLFDSITYSKGASILRMLEKIVGSDVFRDGLRDYLTSNAFSVGDPTVFYNNLFTNISGEEFMRNWLEEMNYPMLHVHLKVDENGTEVIFNQSRFIISDALDASKLNDEYRWMINVQCILGKNELLLRHCEFVVVHRGGDATHSDVIDVDDTTVDFVLKTREETRVLPEKSYTWIKCNRQFQGFYVTQYSSELSTISSWQRFSSLLEAQPNVRGISSGFLRQCSFYFSSSQMRIK
jgi:aminopeptidase N